MHLQLAANITKSETAIIPEPVFANLNLMKQLCEDSKSEVLEFLDARPLHTSVMKSFIQDNGLEGKDNRGTFYAYRNAKGTIEGVALIGHTTLVESRS